MTFGRAQFQITLLPLVRPPVFYLCNVDVSWKVLYSCSHCQTYKLHRRATRAEVESFVKLWLQTAVAAGRLVHGKASVDMRNLMWKANKKYVWVHCSTGIVITSSVSLFCFQMMSVWHTIIFSESFASHIRVGFNWLWFGFIMFLFFHKCFKFYFKYLVFFCC